MKMLISFRGSFTFPSPFNENTDQHVGGAVSRRRQAKEESVVEEKKAHTQNVVEAQKLQDDQPIRELTISALTINIWVGI